jgi:hypothetical protein
MKVVDAKALWCALQRVWAVAVSAPFLGAAVCALYVCGASVVWAAPKIKVSVVELAADKIPAGLVSSVERTLLLGLKQKPQLKVASLEALMNQFTGKSNTERIEEARKILKRVEPHLEASRGSWVRVKQLKKAVAILERNLSAASKKELALAQFMLARALMTVRKWKTARRLLVRLFGWRLSFRTPRSICRRRCLREVLRARNRARRLPESELFVDAQPKSAKVYLDGTYQGVSPLTVTAPIGTHYLTVRHPGYIKKVVRVRVIKGRKKKLKVSLIKSSEALILEQSLRRIKKTVGGDRASSAIRDLRNFLLLDQVVLVTFKHLGSTRYRVTCYLYDLRTGLRLSKIVQRVSADSVPPGRKWARLLYSDARLDGSLPDPGPEPPGSGQGRVPIYKKWWFWTALAVGIASVAVPLGWGLATRDRGSPTVPKGYNPVTIGF